jgi:hypothetical protein
MRTGERRAALGEKRRGKEERTSGPKGLKDDNVYAGDKSPAYPEGDFFCSPSPRRRAAPGGPADLGMEMITV